MEDKYLEMQITNLHLPTADKEESLGLPKECKKLLVHCRDGTAFRMGTEAGKAETAQPPYFTVKTDTAWFEDNIRARGQLLYFACGTADKMLEIIFWVECDASIS